MGRLTTHVLDTTQGRPGNAIAITLYSVDGDSRTELASTKTNDDGRCDSPLLEGDQFEAGVYELLFSVGAYFAKHTDTNKKASEPAFLDDVIIRFGVASADEHYHVPLLITPYSYSTYRGS